jgi:NAD(P)-dependent dehydrogenase (short-subunit alcohol dehydrogenase family)
MRILITGTSRGIGLELTRLALEQSMTVLAVARKPQESKELQNLKAQHPKLLQTIEADLTGSNAVETIKAAVGSEPLDLIINNAGIFRQGETLTDMLESFHVNSCMPLLLTQALLPNLKKAKAPRAVHITSLMGSIDDNSGGGYYAYRASKAALNMFNKSLSIDHPWLSTIVVHPGWVQTDMGGAQAPVQPTDSAKGIWSVTKDIEGKKSGHFYDFTGKELPW